MGRKHFLALVMVAFGCADSGSSSCSSVTEQVASCRATELEADEVTFDACEEGEDEATDVILSLTCEEIGGLFDDADDQKADGPCRSVKKDGATVQTCRLNCWRKEWCSGSRTHKARTTCNYRIRTIRGRSLKTKVEPIILKEWKVADICTSVPR